VTSTHTSAATDTKIFVYFYYCSSHFFISFKISAKIEVLNRKNVTFVTIRKKNVSFQKLIKIDESRCTGCGTCVSGCHGGALQLIDGKAKIINEMYCDGLGACIGECPVGALSLEEREIEPYKVEPQKTESDNEPPCCNHIPSMRQFPIQLRLINSNAPFLHNKDLILAADCTAFVCSDFHNWFMKNNSIVIACPKLDNLKDYYVEKLTEMIEHSLIYSLTVILMEVPCCGGLWHIAQQAQANAKRKIEIKKVIIGINGNIKNNV
jgi:ferredoxin